MGKITATAATALIAAAGVASHGHVNHIVIDGVAWPGYDVNSMPYQNPPPIVVGWSATNLDNGFVAPAAFGDPDAICHRGAGNAKGYARVNAGDTVTFQWTEWPASHKGPVIDYLAPCGSRCDTVDKTSLRFFKIAESDFIDGVWAADVLLQNNNTWTTQIPSNIAPGHYVLRHQILALHEGFNPNGAQDYPQCFNIEVLGSGTASPDGTPGQELMSATDPGVLFNIYVPNPQYVIPGPPLIAGAAGVVEQTLVTATAGAEPLLYGGGGTPTTTAQTTATPSPTGAAAPAYGQCGGIGWSGPTSCGSGFACTRINDYYSQCLPA